VRRERDAATVTDRIEALRRAAAGQENLMPFILAAVRSNATLGEICDVLRSVFGEYLQVPSGS
ncbi:MAG: methylmalonyl-CoA mutase family protein, partial [Dehalococcoidia bacterium]|nr:methylmalonyl-CoA mutase family protein [Dehalococcoidia bacterium]